MQAALNTGAQGYVLKADAGSELLPAVKAVLANEEFVSSGLKGYAVGQAENPLTPSPTKPKLRFLHKLSQLGFWNLKFRHAAIKADDKLWKHPNDGLFYTSVQGNEYRSPR